jgi:enoyl-CoA hydratase/carnithine racemase
VSSGIGQEGEPVLRVDRPADGVAVVVLNRPDRLNALDERLFAELPRVFDGLAADDAVRVVVVTGAGPGFCAGADLVGARPPSDFTGAKAWMQEVHRGPLAVWRLPQPTIAAVNGPAAGGGLGLALSCDIRIAGPSATFSAPFVRMGLVPDFGVSRLLPRIAGTSVAMELVLTGRKLGAEEALRIGLISRLTEDPLAASLALAERIATMPGGATQRIKALIRDAAGSDHEAVLGELEPTAQALGISDPQFVERVTAWHATKSGRPPAT